MTTPFEMPMPVSQPSESPLESCFPLTLIADPPPPSLAEVSGWVNVKRRTLLEYATTHGAVLLRGFPGRTAEDFDAVIAALELSNFPYGESLSNAVRINRTERVFSANEAPPDVRIFFHHEMAQTPLFPKYIFFFCEIAADEGGATPLCRSDLLYQQLRERAPKFTERCEQLGLRYTNVMPDENDPKSGMGRSWRSTLGVESREQAEAQLSKLAYEFEWLSEGCLRVTTPPLPAVMNIDDERKTFFNQLIAAFCGWKDSRNDPAAAIRHGDGTMLDADAVKVAGEISEELAYDHVWQPGDIVLIDNTVVMHARRPFRGTRKVLASLAEKRTQRFSPLTPVGV